MVPEAIQALLADPDRVKAFMSNLLAERTRELEGAKRKRDGVVEQKKRILRDQARAEQVCWSVLPYGGGRSSLEGAV